MTGKWAVFVRTRRSSGRFGTQEMCTALQPDGDPFQSGMPKAIYDTYAEAVAMMHRFVNEVQPQYPRARYVVKHIKT